MTKKRLSKELSNSTNSSEHALKPIKSHTESRTRSAGISAPTVQRRPSSLRVVIRPSEDSQNTMRTSENSMPSTHSSAHSNAGSIRDYAWSNKDTIGADDDASIRPLPPTSPPSPVPSRSTYESSFTSGGFTSGPRSARSMATPSTKPTTLMSVDYGPGGHIAQVPSISSSMVMSVAPRNPHLTGLVTPSGSPVSTRFHHTRTSSSTPLVGSVSFSPLTETVPSSSRLMTTSSPLPAAVTNLITAESPTEIDTPTASTTTAPTTTLAVPATQTPASGAGNGAGSSRLVSTAQVPGHSHLHPRNNPRPASPPPDNASTLTLASSTFALSYVSPHPRSQIAEREMDAAASVRALRPSSRRGSWGSDETGWSAAGLSTYTGVSSAGPTVLLFGLGGPMLSGPGGVPRRRGPGSIATARSAWSYRGTGLGMGERTGTAGEVEVDEDDETNAVADGSDRDEDEMTDEKEIRTENGEELTPTEEVTFDVIAPSPSPSGSNHMPTTPISRSPEEIALPDTPVDGQVPLPAV